MALISSKLDFSDRLGACKARWGIDRMNYMVPPGLYAIGTPAADDPVLVTANYKMSYDIVRRSLAGRSVWLLVLETYGINVWCAAGKGTFGTGELVRRIASSGLSKVVSHRRVILPILGAPGVSAHEVICFSYRRGLSLCITAPGRRRCGRMRTLMRIIRPRSVHSCIPSLAKAITTTFEIWPSRSVSLPTAFV